MQLNGIPAFDAAIMEFVQTHLHNALTDFIFPIFTYLGEFGLIWILLAVTMLFIRRTRKAGILILAAMLITFLTGELVIKNIVMRPRPCTAFPDIPLLIPRPGSFSFPSGHSASSFTAAVMLFLFHKKWGCAALALAVLIAFSRVFLFVHYPTDILAGAILGTVLALITYRLLQRPLSKLLENKQNK